MKILLNRKFLFCATLIVLGLCYQGLSRYLHIMERPTSLFVPGLHSIVQQGFGLTLTSEFWVAFFYSNMRVVIAFVLSMVIGIPVGIALVKSATVYQLFAPLLYFLRYVPVASLVPITIIMLGVDDIQKIVVLFLGTVFHVIVMTEDSLMNFPHVLSDTAKTLGMQGRALVKKVIIPSILPQLFDAGRVAMGLCWSYLLVAEIVASSNGLGYLAIRFQRFLQVPELYFLIIFLGITGVLYDQLFLQLKPKLFPRVYTLNKSHARA